MIAFNGEHTPLTNLYGLSLKLLLYCKHPKIRLIWDAYLTMERRQINAPAAKLRGTVAVLKIYREETWM